ncbi:Type I restriction-modification system, specificity subunit S [Methanosarcina siciliae HI350]|uniref:Type I restriction-modification system, specificity subunit S n=2 Tax=Methanosarcina siciliae TaxID=38027 RepID=A0A0E3PD55_9EURY|nr:restriction endonuclease subunit S [Methanosarcina siciliae]AKB31998.1 Type I restriction-modification system, specificity subunit S [Methanosarcina siciliae HI350]
MKENWEVKKLGEISKINYGYTEKSSFEEIGPRFLRITDIQENNVDWETVPFCKMEKDQLSKYILNEGDIVFARTGATTGKSFLVKNPPLAVFASYLIRLKILDLDKLAPEFLFLFFQTKTYWDKIETGLSGSAQGGFNATKLADISIPLPSLREQQLIVSILDETFAAIDKAKENAERNLQNARELFDSYLKSVFANTGNGWERKKLGKISVVNMGQSPKGSSYNTTGDGVPLINGPVEFGGDDPFSKTLKTKFTTEPTKMCKQGDLVLCVRGSTTGRMNIAGFDSCIGRGVASISSAEYQDWINQYINFNRDTIYKLGTGATFPNVSSSTLSNLLIPIPPKEQQRSIIAKLDALSSETKRLEAIYQQKLAALDELKKSVLQKAFNGELTGA